jgi:hypothetical protein
VRGRGNAKLYLADLIADPTNEFILDEEEADPEDVPSYWWCRLLMPEESATVTWK